MFTSGSTGSPQGVVVSRRALARYIATLDQAFDLSESDVYLHTASFSFSASIRQLVAPLAAGATIAIASEEAKRDPFLLLERMKSWEVTVWDTVPSVWRIVEQVLSRIGSEDQAVAVAETLRLVLLTGEPLSWDLVRAWRRHLRDHVVIKNLYSQTETAGTVAVHTVPRKCPDDEGPVPFGEPLPGVDLLLLDQDLNPVSPGSKGEIFVASDRLADGYLHAEKKSAHRFLRRLEVDRLYDQVCRTGDFAHLGVDGLLTPAGRRDHRIKIRGFRIDLGEIESELARDPRLAQAVACAEPSAEPGELHLVAYVVPTTGSTPSPEAIRSRLSESLPPQAVPGQIVLETDILTTPSGKVDRGALQTRRQQRLASRTEAASGDELERLLLAVWEQVLGYQSARIDDDFFGFGGDSLLAISLFLEIERHCGVRLPPSTLFTAATVRGLAPLLRAGSGTTHHGSLLQLNEGGEMPPLFLVHALWEHLPHFRQLVKLLDPEMPVYALEPTRDHRDIDRHSDIDQLIEEYARDVRAASSEGPFFLGGWSIGGLMAFGVAAELEASGTSPASVLLIDSASPSVRPGIRQKRDRENLGWLHHGGRLLARQLRSFRLHPREQWERTTWALDELRRRLREFIRRPPGHEIRERLKHEFRVIVDRYQPPPYHGAVTLFRSEQNFADPQLNRDLGWSDFALGDVQIVPMPGDHVSLVIEPHNMRLLAARITETIEQALHQLQEAPRSGGEDHQKVVDQFLEQSKKLSGHQFTERQPWNNVASRDAIRQFAFGICDDNPLWTDSAYAASGPFGRLLAPPAFLVSARYPILHGAPVDAPLLSLLKDIELTWEKRVFEGDELQSSTQQGEAREVIEPGGNRRIYIDSLTTYRDVQGELIGRARGTVVRMLSQGDFQIDEWSAHEYGADDLKSIQDKMLTEKRTGQSTLRGDEIAIGTPLPTIVRGPLNIGDMVCWHAAVGPSYRPGPLGYKDILETPQFRVLHPITGWPIKYMLQHEDSNLAHQRGMPAPFDNGVMRFAWVSPLVTNWMGDRGFLARLKVTIHQPVLYGDTNWYTGEIIESSAEGEHTRIGIRILGTNQNGSITTSGSAEVLLEATMSSMPIP
jgi:aspartate racemase